MNDKFDLPDTGEMDGGENPDVCSLFTSILNQRQSVERLINWLRDSQTACTDTNCFDDVNGLPGSEHGAPLDNSSDYADADAFALVMWFVVGLLTLYAMNFARNRDNNVVTTPKQDKDGKSSKGPGGDSSRYRRDNDDDHSSPTL